MATIFWTGDSIAETNYYSTYPKTGIGQVFYMFLKNEYTVENYARGGWSSKSFIEEGKLKRIEDQIKEGDFLFIQYGLNDADPKKPYICTEPFSTFIEELAVYISAAKNHGAYPVLITPIGLADYAEGMKIAAKRYQVPLIDLYTLSHEEADRVGEEKSKVWYVDNAYLHYEGAVHFASLIAREMRALGGVYADMLRDVYEPFQIFGNLYFVGTKSVSSHLIDTGEGLILLDTSYPQTVDVMLDNIRQLGFSLQDIKIILHSHGHVDHIGGTARLVKMTGAKTYIGELDKDMVTGKIMTNFAEELGFSFQDFFTPDVLLKDGDEIRLGNTVITAIHSPGHTPGTMSYFLDITDGKDTYRSGMMGGAGINSMEYRHLNKYGLTDRWRKEYPQVIERLRKYRVEVQMGNHNGDIGILSRYAEMKKTGRNTFIDSTSWDKHLDSCLERYYKMIEEGR